MRGRFSVRGRTPEWWAPDAPRLQEKHEKNRRPILSQLRGWVCSCRGLVVPDRVHQFFLDHPPLCLWCVSGSRVTRRPRKQGCEQFLVFLYQTWFCWVQKVCSCRSSALLQVETKKPCRAENPAVDMSGPTALVRPSLGGLSYVGQPLHCLLFSVAVLWRACLM